MQTKIIELESIRGLAAILVFLSHIPSWHDSFHQITFIRNGGLMVELFFVLSGFVIFSTYGTRINSLKQIAQFQFLRFGRLYPIHLTFLLLFVGFELMKLLFIANPVSPPFAAGISGPREFLENLTLTQALGFSRKPDSFNGPSWSISTEFYTYLVFAFIALVFSRRQLHVHAGLLIALAFLLAADLPVLSDFSRFMTCLAGFSTGCLVAMFVGWIRSMEVVLPSFAPLFSALLLIAFLVIQPRGSGIDIVVTFGLSAILIVTIVCSSDGSIKRTLRTKPLVVVGLHSYSLYMCHWAVIYMADVILKRTSMVPMTSPMSAGQLGSGLGVIGFVAVLLLVCGVVALISWASFRFIEQPFRMKSRAYAYR